MSLHSSIEAKLLALDPVHLEVVNESHMHSVPANSETHFRVTVVSERFDGQPLLARHRVVNGMLEEELAAGVHALALHTRTPDEWFAQGGAVPESPPCLGGSKAT